MTKTLTDAFDDFPATDTLLVTVEDDETFRERGHDGIERLADDDSHDRPDRLSVPDLATLFDTFGPETVELLETISADDPDSIRETARLVKRDVKNVHEELTRLSRLGVVQFADDGRAKRPVFPYSEVVIGLPFDRDERNEEETVHA